MAKMARVVVPGLAQHVARRGNRRHRTSFGNEDFAAYRQSMGASCKGCGTCVRACCLTPNHVDSIMVPRSADGLRSAVAQAHRRHTRMINFREGWRDHLRQERLHAFVTDEQHLPAAPCYMERNPARAGLCDRAQDWPWSSAQAHLRGANDEWVELLRFWS